MHMYIYIYIHTYIQYLDHLHAIIHAAQTNQSHTLLRFCEFASLSAKTAS